MQYKKNLLSASIVKKILNEPKIKKNTDDKLKSFIIENLMINYSINYNENKNKTKEIFIYFSIIINNNAIISKDYFVDWNILNKIVEKYLNSKEYDKIIDFLSNIKELDFVNKYLKHDSIETLIKSVPIEKILLFHKLIKNNNE